MSQPFVAVLMGSKSDLPVLEKTLEVLEGLGIPHEARITSAHRTPEATHAYVRDADARGCAVFIAAAGLAAHLAGTVAGLTLKPVIGIPLDAGPLKGMDSLLSTVQMPGGVPVATVAIGSAGARNAGYLAAQILALGAPAIAARLRAERDAGAAEVAAADAALQASRDPGPQQGRSGGRAYPGHQIGAQRQSDPTIFGPGKPSPAAFLRFR